MERCPYCFKLLPKSGICDCRYEESPNAGIEDTLRPGTIVGAAYLIGAVLGKGGFGITYRGYDLNMERIVAIKEFYPDGMVTRGRLLSEVSRNRSEVIVLTERNKNIYGKSLDLFYREAKALSKLEKLPNVVHAYHIFRENGTAYIVMEFVEGRSLSQMIREKGSIPEKELLPLLDPALIALGKVHEAGILHRDIAPDNIMIENGQPILIDFGAARVEEGHASSLLIGKKGYSSPEQMAGGKVDSRSDIYSLGATYYKALSGETPQDSVQRMMDDHVIPLKDLVPGISPHVSNAVMKAMSLKPEDRWSSAEEFRKALNKHPVTETKTVSWGNGSSNSGIKNGTDGTSGKSKTALLMILPLLVLFAGGYFFFQNFQKNQDAVATLDAFHATETASFLLQASENTGTGQDNAPFPTGTAIPQPTATLVPAPTNTVVPTETPIDAVGAYEQGHKAFSEKNYDAALPLLTLSAEAGNADAMVDLGRMYWGGWGVETDDSLAVSWFRKAADQNNAEGQYWMGVMYRDGRGVPRDYTQAYEWYLKAAGQENADAQNGIGYFYEYGNYGLTQNYSKAYEWYQKAADNGSTIAMRAIGRLYELGRGFAKNPDKALEWYKKAADLGDDYGLISIGSLYQSQKNFAEAEKWYLKAVEQQGPNSAYAESRMGSLYSDYSFNENASDAEQAANYEKSREWYLKAAEHGDKASWSSLGSIYFYGLDNVQQSYEKALEYYRKGADAGDSNSMMDIAEMYYMGYGVPQSFEKTIDYLKSAMEKENFGAYLQLGLFYEYGIGVEKNMNEAKRLYQYAVDHGSQYIIEPAQKLLNGDRKNIPSNAAPMFQELLTRISLDSYQLFNFSIDTLADRYVLMDIDGFGTDELVIGSTYHTESIFRVKNGYMEDILKMLEDNSYDSYPNYAICKNKIIQKKNYIFGYRDVSNYKSYYKYTGNSFSFLEAIVESENLEYYHSTVSETSLSGQKLTYDERKAIEERYPEMEIDWIMLK